MYKLYDNDIPRSADVPRSSVDDVIDSVIRNTKDTSNNTTASTTLSSSTSTHAEPNVTQQHQPITTAAAANKDSSHMEAAHTHPVVIVFIRLLTALSLKRSRITVKGTTSIHMDHVTSLPANGAGADGKCPHWDWKQFWKNKLF